MSRIFDGKVALVTGAANGIGKAAARRIAENGGQVVMADLSPKLEELAAKWRQEGLSVTAALVDVQIAQTLDDAVKVAQRVYGGLDIAISSAGIFPRAELLETTDAFWDRVMDINLKGTFHTCRAVVPAMIERGGGVILTVGSLNAAGGAPNLFAYATSKGGVRTLTVNLARSLAKHRIRVNCVHPGWVVTEGEREVQKAQGRSENWIEEASSHTPLGRLQTPEDIAGTLAFLASDEANQITGQEIAVDGGLGMHY